MSMTSILLEIVPPWLRRLVGERVLLALGAPIDSLVTRGAESIKHRFPGVVDDSSLDRIGAERRIRRGPGESATTYARRLRWWLDDHRVRGNPYPLLRQLYFFFRDTFTVRMDLVYHSGTRRWLPAGLEANTPDEVNAAITRDSISWNADGSDQWSQFWVFFHLSEELVDELVTEAGDNIVTEALDELVTDGVNLEEEEDLVFLEIPREWSAAHIFRITVVLFVGTHRLWGYPVPVPTWGTWGTWQSTDPIQLVHEEAA